MYYVYDQPDDTALSQTIFETYQVINRSTNDYSDVYTAFFLDFDIGSPWVDYIGCDTLIQSAFAFNGYSTDEDGGSGTYGNHPPAQSFTCLNYEMSGFMFSNNAWASPMTDPQNDVEYYNYMKSVWRDGSPLTYGGNGYGGDLLVRYSYPGDPVANDGWTEEFAGNLPGDRRGLISSGPYKFLQGDTLTLDFALVFTRDYEGDNFSSVTLLKKRIQQIRDFYVNSLNVKEIKHPSFSVKVYPNPSTGQLFIETNLEGETINWTVVDVLGKIFDKGKTLHQSNFQINFQHLEKGIYLFLLNDGKSQANEIIIKTN